MAKPINKRTVPDAIHAPAFAILVLFVCSTACGQEPGDPPADDGLCVFSPAERLAALESLTGDLHAYVDGGGLYPADLELLPPDVLAELPPALSSDRVWLWPAATEPLGDDDRLQADAYLASTCVAERPACGSPVNSVCYALLDGSAAFCAEADPGIAPGDCLSGEPAGQP